MTMRNIVRRTVFVMTILFFAVVLIGLIFFYLFSLEFIDGALGNDFYLFLMVTMPLALLLTMTGTIKKKNTQEKNWIIGTSTILLAVACVGIMYNFMFQLAFGAWTNETILYRYKNDKTVSINIQRWDIGALGYGGQRVVEVDPFLKYFAKINSIDTTKLNKGLLLMKKLTYIIRTKTTANIVFAIAGLTEEQSPTNLYSAAARA